jgi:hypothetical protein
METKKLSDLVIDFFRNDIVWLVFYLAFAATVVERSITWLFFSDFAGGMTLRVVLGLWSTGLIFGHFILGLALVGDCSKYVSHGDGKIDDLLADARTALQLGTLICRCVCIPRFD